MSNPVTFYPLTIPEIQTAQGGIKPLHRTYTCGACAKTTNGRVVCELVRASDGAKVAWCICSCTKEEPAMIIERGGEVVQQLPEAREFKVGENWPPDLAQLYDEAAKTYAAGAYTAATMVCRKVLMACACHEGATDGQNFTLYVDHITAHVLTFPKAKNAIDSIRSIGNDANHQLRFVARDDAKRAMSIVTYMLNTIYSLPSA